jgi:hypothetical protein
MSEFASEAAAELGVDVMTHPSVDALNRKHALSYASVMLSRTTMLQFATYADSTAWLESNQALLALSPS